MRPENCQRHVPARLAEIESTRLFCEAVRDVLELSGVGVALRTSQAHSLSLCSTDAVAAHMEELQFLLGEGPCCDAYEQASTVEVPDLAEASRWWPGFAPRALAAGVRAISSYPLLAASVPIGTLSLLRTRVGTLSVDQHRDALVVASLLTARVVAMQERAPDGQLAEEFEPMVMSRSAVFQACGLIATAIGVGVDEALSRLRAYAFANDLTLDVIADRVLEGRLRLGEQSADPAPQLEVEP